MKQFFSGIILSAAIFFINTAAAQSKSYTVTGRVTSFEESFALPGVAVKIKGSQDVTATKANGTFSISITDPTQTLVFELPEYEPKEIAVGDQRRFDVVLQRKNGMVKLLQEKACLVSNKSIAR